jgi:hypothetical protein
MSPTAKGAILWTLAVILMMGAAVHQRLTGPTHPLRGEMVVGGDAVRYRLPRSEESVRDLRVAIPSPGPGSPGRVLWRRYPTDEGFRVAPMAPETDEGGLEVLVAHLPAQPAAGKLEYRIEVGTPAGILRIPEGGGRAPLDAATVVMRYKDPVPLPLLLSHIAFMFFAVLVGMRAGLGSLAAPGNVRVLSWVSLGLMTVGGMILGPLVQKSAFGAYWTGFPWGYDLTDNKTLIMWLAWIVACAALGRPGRADVPGWSRRLTVFAAAVVMTVVYLIPHSLRGSQLDFDQVESGSSAADAVRTGN